MSAEANKIVEALLDGGDDPKDYAYDRIEIKDYPFRVSSSHGHWDVSAATGTVLDREVYAPEFDDTEYPFDAGAFINVVERFDVNEYRQWLKQHFEGEEAEIDGADCLFIGWWNKDGSYNAPEQDARDEYLRERDLTA